MRLGKRFRRPARSRGSVSFGECTRVPLVGAALAISLLLILGGCAPLQQLGGPQGPIIRVLLASTKSSAKIVLKHPGWVSADGRRSQVQLVPGVYRIVLQADLQTKADEPGTPWSSGEPLLWGGPLAAAMEVPAVPLRIRLENASGGLRLEARRSIEVSADRIELLQPKDLEVPGDLVFALDGTEIAVINRLPLEMYLRGVVPAEMWTNAPLEALKAQAVVARTTGYLSLKRNRRKAPYDLCSSEKCQVYLGVRVWSSKADQAIRATAGEVLTLRGHVCEAPYSAVCGGHTEDASLLWSGEKQRHLHGVLDASLAGDVDLRNSQTLRRWLTSEPKVFCSPTQSAEPSARKYFRWRIRLSEADIRRRVRASTGVDVGLPLRLRVLSRGVSGRALTVLVEGPYRSVKIRGELAIRRGLAHPALPSSCFVLQKQGNAWVLLGAGYGHGVGLCQAGAVGMARLRNRYREILQHYYPGTRVVRKY